MKLLLDTCIAPVATEVLRNEGHDVVWTGNWKPDPGDDHIFRAAVVESRILVTADKDFGELAMVHGIRHCGLIRLVGFRASDQGPAIRRLLATYHAELSAGAIVTADPWRVRVRIEP